MTIRCCLILNHWETDSLTTCFVFVAVILYVWANSNCSLLNNTALSVGIDLGPGQETSWPDQVQTYGLDRRPIQPWGCGPLSHRAYINRVPRGARERTFIAPHRTHTETPRGPMSSGAGVKGNTTAAAVTPPAMLLHRHRSGTPRCSHGTARARPLRRYYLFSSLSGPSDPSMNIRSTFKNPSGIGFGH